MAFAALEAGEIVDFVRAVPAVALMIHAVDATPDSEVCGVDSLHGMRNVHERLTGAFQWFSRAQTNWLYGGLVAMHFNRQRRALDD